MKSKKTQYMTSMALFLAIEIILVVTPLGYIPIGPLNATTMHIPVIIAGIVLGKKAGAELGFVFGLTSLIKATIQPGITSFCFSALLSRLLSQPPSKSISPKIFPFPHQPQGFQHRTHSFPLSPHSLYSISTSHCSVFLSIFCAAFLLCLSPPPPLLQLVFVLSSFV